MFPRREVASWYTWCFDLTKFFCELCYLTAVLVLVVLRGKQCTHIALGA